MVTELCWKESETGYFCKNYKKNGQSRCRFHNESSYKMVNYILVFIFSVFITLSTYFYNTNKLEYNVYIYEFIHKTYDNLNQTGNYMNFYIVYYKQLCTRQITSVMYYLQNYRLIKM